MTVWDLATLNNWELILAEQRNAQSYKRRTAYNYQYEPISDIFATPNNHTLLIGSYSNKAKLHWTLGAKASQYLYISPSTISNLIGGVQGGESKTVRLNQLTLIEFPNYSILPYILRLEIPHWLEHIYIEVWEYLGQADQPLENRLADIEDALARVEFKLDNSNIIG